jgi:hypothetical protein
MPKTKYERLIFTLFGVLFMATTMAFFNKYLVLDTTFSSGMTSAQKYAVLWHATFTAFLQKAPLAFVLQFFFVQKFAGRMTAKYATDNVYLGYMIRTAFSVMIMCPVMSLYSNLFLIAPMHWNFVDLLYHWIPKMMINGLFAYCVQIMILQPVNRWIFRMLFRRTPAAAK